MTAAQEGEKHPAVDELRRRIVAEGENLGGGILKVDSIINHQVDPVLMYGIGQEFAQRFTDMAINKVLTAEISGIGPALMTGLALGVPVVYARKHRPITMKDPVYTEKSVSPTKKQEVQLIVSHEFLLPGDKVLIVDDFLASGQTLHALAKIIQAAGAEVMGIACVIEKEFQGGRAYLSQHLAVQVESAAIITDMNDGEIHLK